MRGPTLFSLVLGIIAFACGGGTSGGGGGAGGGGGSGGGGPGPVPTGKGLEISTGLGISVLSDPLPAEASLRGTVLVSRDKNPPEELTVTVNGEELRTVMGIATFNDGQRIPDVGPGKTLQITATDEEGSQDLALPCPGGIEITSPQEGATVHTGEELTVSWSGDPFAMSATTMMNPALLIRGVGFDGKLEMSNVITAIEPGETSATIKVPGGLAGEDAYLAFTIPGELVETENGEGGSHFGICVLELRRKLEVEDP